MVVLDIRWEGLTPEQYETLKKNVGWVQNPNPNGYIHLVWAEGNGLHAVDVWESAESFEEFTQTRLPPAAHAIGIPNWPEVATYPVLDTFVLGYAPEGVGLAPA